jgi:hypothetical protein
VIKELDDTELFNRVARGNDRFDDEWIEDVDDLIRDEGVLVGRQKWDSGGRRSRSNHSPGPWSS